MLKYIFIIIILFIMGCSNKESSIDEARILLENKYPNIAITGIEKIDQKFYEVRVGDEIYYMTTDLQHLIAGNIIELSTGSNLTEDSFKKTRLERLSNISDDNIILYPSENSKYTVTIFSDTSCPYCQKLHNEIDNLVSSGVSVRYVLFSRNGNDTEAYNDMVSVWCSENRRKSLDDLFDNSFIEKVKCKNPIDDNYSKAMSLQVNGTPMIFFEDGSVIPGYVSSDKIIEALATSRSD